MALFFPNIGPDYREKAVHAAVHLQRLLGHDSSSGGMIPVRIGVNAGARLQAAAKAGEIVIAEELYKAVEAQFAARALKP